MSIQQALFAGSSVLENWTLVDTWSNAAQGDNVSMPNTQSGDILLAFVGRRDSNPPGVIGSTFTTIVRGDNGSDNIGYGVFAKVCSGATSLVTSTEFNNYDCVFYCAFRTLNAFTSTSSVLWKGETGNGTGITPTHNNTVANFGMNSLALPAVWYSRAVGSTWVPPANTTLVGSDNQSANDKGSVAVSSQEIGPAGNYSWGAWGATNINKYWMTGYVEVQQP